MEFDPEVNKAEINVMRAEDIRHHHAGLAGDTALAICQQMQSIADGVCVPADIDRLSQLCDMLNQHIEQTVKAIRLVAKRQETLERLRRHPCAAPSTEHEDGAPQGS